MKYLGLDIGTSGCKAAIISDDAQVLAFAHEEYDLIFPQRGYAELDPEEIFIKIKNVLKTLAPMTEDVKAMALSSFGEAFVLLDKEEKPLCNFITYADNRCEGIDQKLLKTLQENQFFAITGIYPNQSFSLCRLVWLQKHCPEILQKTEKLFFANDYYNYLLSGNRGVDGGTASKSLMLDIREKNWSRKILDTFQIPESWLSPVLEVGSSLGNIREELAKELGISKEIKIFLGCHDQFSATLGGGVLSPGSAVMGEGSTGSLNVVVGREIFEHKQKLIERKLCLEPFLDEKYMMPLAFLTYGNAIRWYIKAMEKERAELLPEGIDIFMYLEEQCSQDTDLICLPYLSDVNLMDPGHYIPGAFIGLTLDTKKWEFYRALIQGLNFEIRNNKEVMEQTGNTIQNIYATGGITKSEMFMQLQADVLQSDIHILSNKEAGIIGLAIICAVSCGTFDNYEEAIGKFVRIVKTYHPQKNYDALYQKYCHTRNLLRQTAKEKVTY